MNNPNEKYIDTSGMCYSNLVAYGAGGRVNTIVAPQPVGLVPQLFRLQKPHPFISPPPVSSPGQCSGYKIMGEDYK